jgi:SNF family Na+-dependent transporter
MKTAMKDRSLSTQSKARTIIFLLSLWIVGMVLTLWFGLGWFFLIETLRRIIIAIPKIYLPFLRVVVSLERANEEKQLLNQKEVRKFYTWRMIVALIWLLLTIIVFLYANIRLADFL